MLQSSIDLPVHPTTLLIGRDAHGHWLVQEQEGELEGSFISRDAALSFARWERHGHPGAKIEFAPGTLTSRLFG